jgi:hypothetical protein
VDEGAAIAAGMGYFKYTQGLGIRTGAGISTLVNWDIPPIWALALNEGWQHVEHAATAFGLLSDVGSEWLGSIANPDPSLRPSVSDVGLATLVALADRVTKRYTDRTWIRSGNVIVDPAHPPEGNLAYFTFQNLVVGLRAERLVLTLPFGTP